MCHMTRINKYYKGISPHVKVEECEAGVRAGGGGRWRGSFMSSFFHYMGCSTVQDFFDESWSPVFSCQLQTDPWAPAKTFTTFSFKWSLNTQQIFTVILEFVTSLSLIKLITQSEIIAILSKKKKEEGKEQKEAKREGADLRLILPWLFKHWA